MIPEKRSGEILNSDIDFAGVGDQKLCKNNINGVLIYALEDEYFEIRLAALNAIYTLGKANKHFAKEVRDLLFHILNDENDQVTRPSMTVVVYCV
jgi:lysozyme family protein